MIKYFLDLKPKKIIYISCNPSTLGRALKLLCERYYFLEVICPIDIFSHTYHIESIAKLSKNPLSFDF